MLICWDAFSCQIHAGKSRCHWKREGVTTGGKIKRCVRVLVVLPERVRMAVCVDAGAGGGGPNQEVSGRIASSLRR